MNHQGIRIKDSRWPYPLVAISRTTAKAVARDQRSGSVMFASRLVVTRSRWHRHEKSSLSMETDRTSRSSGSRSWQRGSYRGQSGRRRKRRQKPWDERIADWTRAL